MTTLLDQAKKCVNCFFICANRVSYPRRDNYAQKPKCWRELENKKVKED